MTEALKDLNAAGKGWNAKQYSDMQVMDGQSITSFLPDFLPTTFLPVSLIHFLWLNVNMPLKRKSSAYR